MTQRYTVDQIVPFSTIEAIRRRPAMYLGATGEQGLHSLVNELFNSTLEEFRQGHARQLSVRLHADGSLTWADDGRPLGTEPRAKLGGCTEIEAALTKLCAGGRLGRSSQPERSDTLSFVVANALSRWLRLETGTGSDHWSIECARGEIVRGPLRAGHTTARRLSITFCPDEEIFGEATFDFQTIASRLRVLSFLNTGLSIEFVDERTARSEQFHDINGASDFIRFLDSDQTVLYPEVIRFAGVEEGVRVEIALQHRADFCPVVLSYANSYPTPRGGTHLDAFLAGFTSSLTRYGIDHGIMEQVPLVEDYCAGLTAIVSVQVDVVQFVEAAMTAIGNVKADRAIAGVLDKQLPAFLEQNSAITEQIISKALSAATCRKDLDGPIDHVE